MPHRAAPIALLVAALVGLAPAARADDPPEVTFEQAMATAQAQVPGGTLLRARVEGTNFGFYFWVRPRVVEVEISKNQNFKKRVKQDDEVSQDVVDMMEKMTRGKTKLPDGRIAEIAGGTLNGTPLTGMTYAIVGGRLVAQVGDNLIDAQTGKVTPAPKAPAK
jgi:hypothetical protein